MKTKQKNIVKLTVNLLALSLVLASGLLYSQTHFITSKENIKFNTSNNNNPTLAFDNGWSGTLNYQRSTGKFSFNKRS